MWYESILDILQTLLSVLVGGAVVYYFGIRQLKAQQRLAFRERQLAELYAPLAGLRKQIRAKGELRVRISEAAEAAWQDICKTYEGRPMLDHDERFAPFKELIDYDNTQLETDLIPKYREMLGLFTERYHLADRDTRSFYQEFLEFVEVWNRWLAGALPPDVLQKLGHTETTIQPFYEHLESKMQHLQEELARG